MVVDDPFRFADKFAVKSSRLPNWDYSSPGIYFNTICTLNHNNFFGKIVDNKMVLSTCGQIARDELIKTIQIRNNISIDLWVIMPNHIHLLITIYDCHVETPRGASLRINPTSLQQNKVITISQEKRELFQRLNTKSNQIVPKMINQFKSRVTLVCRQNNFFFAWQSRFYDEIIKDNQRFMVVKHYIQNNIANWNKDKFYR